MNPVLSRSVCLSLLTVASLAPIEGRAQPPRSWSLAGAGCVPAGQTAAAVGTFNSAGDSKFAALKTGEIILTCPVPSSLSGARFFGMTYRDPDARTHVRAVLRQKELSNGAVSDVTWARLDSNSFPAAPSTVRVSALAPQACNGTGFVFDHDRFTYYIQVNMRRTAASADVLLAWVDLGNLLIC